MRKLAVLACLALLVAACGGGAASTDSGGSDPSGPDSSPPPTAGLSASDRAFNAEVLERFRIVDVAALNVDTVEDGFGQDIIQPMSPAEAAVRFLCGDGLPDGYAPVYGFGPAGPPPDAEALIQGFQAYAIETYCP